MLSILTLVSCGDDDEGGTFMDDSMVETWTFATYDVELTSTVVGFGSDQFSSTLISSDAEVTFESGGTWTSTGETEFEITEGDSTYTETGLATDSGTWSVSGQVVKIESNQPDSNATFIVDELTVVDYDTDARVALASEVDETMVDPFFGFTITTTGTVDIVLEQ